MTSAGDIADPLRELRSGLAAATARWSAAETIADIRKDFTEYLVKVGPRGAQMAQPIFVPSTLDFDIAWIGSGPRRVLYCHGGGFQIGGISSHSSLVARLAGFGDAKILLFDYRLAPEHRYPAAIDDAFAAYKWMLDNGGAPVAIIGDSAGGALALRTAQLARDAGMPLPKAIALISPWLDLSMQGESYQSLADRDIFSKPEQLRAMARTYLGRHGPAATSAEVSPLWGDLEELPAILIHAGSADITLDDSKLLKARVRAAGGNIDLQIFDHMCHHFQVFEALPNADLSLRVIGDFLKQL